MTDQSVAPIIEIKNEQVSEVAVEKSACATKKSFRTRNWVFTWNNYTDESLELLRKLHISHDMKCIMYGKETAPVTLTRHLQGFFTTKNPMAFHQIKAMLPKEVHFEAMAGRVSQNVTYCSKGGNVVLLGKKPCDESERVEKVKAARTILSLPEVAQLKESKLPESDNLYIPLSGKGAGEPAPFIWRSLDQDILQGMSLSDLVLKYPSLAGQYNKGFLYHYEMFRPKNVFNIREKYPKLYDWEVSLLEILEKAPSDRAVYWIWSEMGNVGKSEMIKHLVGSLGFQALNTASTRDIACAWRGGSVAFDFARSEGEINYKIIEYIKNRMVFSSKYESQTKASDDFKSVFVVCFSNSPPDVTTLSMDRWNIYKINPDDNYSWTLQDASIFKGSHSDRILSILGKKPEQVL